MDSRIRHECQLNEAPTEKSHGGTDRLRSRPAVPRFLMALISHGVWQRRHRPEEQVKAVFVFNFSHFVEWPAQSFSSAVESIRHRSIGRRSVRIGWKKPCTESRFTSIR